VTTLKLALVAALWMVAIAIGSFGTSDTDMRLRITHSWWSGAPEVDPRLPKPETRLAPAAFSTVGTNGTRRIFWDTGQSILMLPGDWLGTKLQRWVHAGPRSVRTAVVSWLVFMPLNVAMVLACFWLLRLFGSSEQLAAIASLIWLLATTALPYAQIAFQNNQVLLFVIVAHAAILGWVQTRRHWLIVASGLAAGAALLVRASCVIHVFTIGLFLLGCIALDKGAKRKAAGVVAAWSAGFVPLLVLGRVIDFVRYGSFFTTGQTVWLQNINTDPLLSGLPHLAANYPFIYPPAVGILGVLFSPAKSIFLYDPLLAPCLLIAAFSWRTLSPYLRLFIAAACLNLLLHIVLTSRIDFWAGDWSWGARYQISTVDLLLIPLLPSLIRGAYSASVRWAWPARGLIALAVVVQFLAVSMMVDEEIWAQALQDPSVCNRLYWDAPLGFRLGRRVDSLYCLASGSHESICPNAIGAEALRANPHCAADVTGLTYANRLVFFPFDPDNSMSVYRMELAIWVAAVVAAIAATTVWLRSAGRRSSASGPLGCDVPREVSVGARRATE
jgi:hypothetical protein